jgi:probable phosphoglycerate mutase
MAAASMTTFVLVRHALHELGARRIAGRMPGVHLSEVGRAQAAALPGRLRALPITAVYTSPLERTRETAAMIVAGRHIEAEPCDGLLEIDFGAWTGSTLEELRGRPEWQQWNSFRSGHRAPGGESMVEVQARVVGQLLTLRERHPHECIALVSHGDVIRAALAHCTGTPLDLFQRIEINPASVSVVVIADHGPWVLCVNNTQCLDELPVESSA